MAKRNNVTDNVTDDVTENMIAGTEGANVADCILLPTQQEGGCIISKDEPHIPVGLFKLSDAAVVPEYATKGSACFDLSAAIQSGDVITSYSNMNVRYDIKASKFSPDNKWGIMIDASHRALVPTGWVFDLPEGTVMRIYPRSGLSLKQDAKLANCVAVIDNDYVEQTYVIIKNESDTQLIIRSGDRICQAEVQAMNPKAGFNQLAGRPKQKTTRDGGLGSTGK